MTEKTTDSGLKYEELVEGDGLVAEAGFDGVFSDDDLVSFHPRIAREWNRYRFRVVYCGAIIEVAVDKHTARFTVMNNKSVTVRIYGKEYLVSPEGVTVDLEKRVAP